MNFLSKYWPLILLLIAGYFPLALHLDTRPIVMWDESRNAINAMEMAENGNIIVRHFEGQPDMWETKPPLLTWMQAVSMKIFGYNAFAVRFPVLLFAFLTLIMIYVWFSRHSGSRGAGLLAGIVLSTTAGYVGVHVSRTGDHDTLLAFFMLLQLFFVFEAVENPQKRNRYLFLFTLALIGAVMTKSIAGLFFLPGILAWVIYSGEFRYLVFRPFTLGMITIFITLVGGYYLIHENLTPGYLKTVWEGEMGPKFTNSSGNHNGSQESIFYYLSNLVRERFYPWFYFLPVSIWLVMNRGSKPEKSFMMLTLAAGLPMFLVISFGTAAFWYDAPLLPLLAIVTGCGLYHLAVSISPGPGRRLRAAPGFFTLLFLVAIIAPPYVSGVDRALHTGEIWIEEQYGPLMAEMEKEMPEIRSYKVLHRGYNANLLFHKEVRDFTGGTHVTILDTLSKVSDYDTIFVNQDFMMQGLESQYYCDTLWEKKSFYLLQLKPKRVRSRPDILDSTIVTQPAPDVTGQMGIPRNDVDNAPPAWNLLPFSPIKPANSAPGWTYPFPIRH